MSYIDEKDKERLKSALAEFGGSPEEFRKKHIRTIAKNRLTNWPFADDENMSCPACGADIKDGHCSEEFTCLEAEVDNVLGLTAA